MKCKKGEIVRSAYTRKDGTRVRATCVKDRGAPGKTPASKRVLPKPVKGSLGKYGYSNIKGTSAIDRRNALIDAVRGEGYATIIRRLNLLSNYNKNNEQVYNILQSDIRWMQNNLEKQYSASATSDLQLLRVQRIAGVLRKIYKSVESGATFYTYRRKSDGKMVRRYV